MKNFFGLSVHLIDNCLCGTKAFWFHLLVIDFIFQATSFIQNVFTYVDMHIKHVLHVEVRGNLPGVGSLLSPCGGLNSDVRLDSRCLLSEGPCWIFLFISQVINLYILSLVVLLRVCWLCFSFQRTDSLFHQFFGYACFYFINFCTDCLFTFLFDLVLFSKHEGT